MGFTEYLTNIRINKAIEIMRNKGESISCIALNCGFSDPLYFSKVFKSFFKVAPVAYRKQCNDRGKVLFD